METTTKSLKFPALLLKILVPLEVISLVGALCGMTLKYLQLPGGDEIMLIGMSSLSCVYFMRAYLPSPSPETKSGGERLAFGSLLVAIILPKLAWLGCSVNLIGLLFGILHFRGAAEMLMVGSSVLAGCILLAVYFVAIGSDQTARLMNVLYRAAPICIFGLYMFMNLPPRSV